MTDINIYKYEEELIDSGIHYIAGVDEAGRGPIAGPLVVASCILPFDFRLEGVNDSKQLSAKKRNELAKIIKQKAITYKTVFIKEKEIDRINIFEATKKGMLEAISGLSVTPEYVLIDFMPLKSLEIPNLSLTHGDALSASIAAASILAKVARDDYMDKMDIKYPGYGFKHNKGYPTPMHLKALDELGPTKLHRKTFHPVNKFFVTEKQMQIDFDDFIPE